LKPLLPKLGCNSNMPKFPIDAPIDRVIRCFEHLGFRLVRQGNHISMVRENTDGTRTPLTMPNHRRIKGSTLRTILNQAGIPRSEFLATYEES
jgi:predicted RNA binding protein YcfA (HicA-like mRNA interferase family)